MSQSSPLERSYEPSAYVFFLEKCINQRTQLLCQYTSSQQPGNKKRELGLAINSTNHKLRSMVSRLKHMGFESESCMGIKIAHMKFDDVIV